MTVVGDVIKALGVALEGLAQVQTATDEAVVLAMKSQELAERVGGKGWLARVNQIKDAVEAEAERLTVMVGNLEQARRNAVAMADTAGRDRRLKEAGALLSPNLRSSGADRQQRHRKRGRPVSPRRSESLKRNGFLIGQFVFLGWTGVTLMTNFPSWVDSQGALVITSVNLWLNLKYRTVDGIPSRWSRRDLRGEVMAFKFKGKARINRKTERVVRQALGVAVAGQGPDLNNLADQIGWNGDEFADEALDLVFAISRAALFSIHHGDRPRDQQLRIMTRDFVEYEAWAEVDFDTTLAYLKALADQVPPREALAIPDQLFAACAIGAWLLSAFIPDHVAWTDFLDGILTKLESKDADVPLADVMPP